MNLAKVINLKYLPILILAFLTLFFHFYQVENRYIFDWDQEDDAVKVTEMIQNLKPRMIGPRVANESGFFVGPFHYYFLLPFFVLFKNNPYSGAYAAIFVSLITVIATYLIISKIFNSKVAFISSFISATSASVISWNVMYTPLLSMIIFYLCYLLIKGKKDIFPYIVFLYSFSFSTHLVPAVLILPIITVILLSKFKPTPKQIVLSIILFIVPLLPLIAFDIKHNFINIISIKSFIFSSKQASENVPVLFLRSFWRSINPIFINNSATIIISRIAVLIISLIEIINIKNIKFRFFILIWFLAPLLILSLYHGNIPEYYYGTTLILFPILIATFINRISSKYLKATILIIFFALQLSYFNTPASGIYLKNKLSLVKYLVSQTQDNKFNLSYDLPIGFNSGYGYLFKYLGKEPQNIPEAHLYSVYLNSSTPKSGQIVYSDNVIGLVRK